MKKFAVLTLASIFTFTIGSAQVIKLVKENNTDAGGDSYPHNLTIANNKLFFIATEHVPNLQLWVSDGTTANTVLVGPTTGVTNSAAQLHAFNGKVYFSYNDGINGQELWTSDGTAAGTVMLKDIYPGSNGSQPWAFTTANNKLFFMATTAAGDRHLFVTDGTGAGTTLVKPEPVDLLNGMDSFAVMNNELYFRSDNGTGSGYGWWKTDGTLTTLLKADFTPGTSGGNYAVLDNKMYFSADEGVTGSELWVTDGTAAGTQLVKNINANDGDGVFANGVPQNLRVYNGKIYFSADDGTHGSELWVTDGTEANTVMVKDVLAGATGSLPVYSIIYNGLLYFTCAGTNELWKTDGTAPNTVQVATGLVNLEFAAIWNNTMYMINSNFAQPVWQSDGTAAGTKQAEVTNTTSPFTNGERDRYFVEYNGDLYLSATCGGITGGYELVKLTLEAVPLQLLSFTGHSENGKDILAWTTTNEVNTSHFTIQQSKDASLFTDAGNVKATNNAGDQQYHFVQQSSANAGLYYRLKMVDVDGKFTYSPVIKLNYEAPGNITAKYNAQSREITISNGSNDKVRWRLMSLNGSMLKQGTSLGAITNISLNGVAKGTYVFVYEAHVAKTLRVVVY